MRIAIFAVLVGVLAACSPPATTEDGGGVGDIAAEGFTMAPETLVGTWSFDRTCASGDGMILSAGGAASFDEWGQGTWATAEGDRIVLSLERHEPGVGPTGEQVTYYLDVAAPVTTDLTGVLARDDGTEQRGVSALRCERQ